MRKLLCVMLLAAACGDDSGSGAKDAQSIDARIDAPAIDAPGIDAPAQPVAVPLNGPANDVLWDATEHKAYVSNSGAVPGTLETWDDTNGLQVVGHWPTQPDGTSPINPGGLVKTADGVFTVDFGFAPAVPRLMRADTDGVAYTGLSDTTKRYLDLEVDTDGTFLTSAFTGGSSPGHIYKLTITDATNHVLTATQLIGPADDVPAPEHAGTFNKLVGMVVTADAIYGSDQTNKKIIKWDRTNDYAQTDFATGLDKGDFLYQLPGGDFLTGGAAVVNRIDGTTGAVSALDLPGVTVTTVHGIAYDAAGHRLFLIDHPGTGDDILHVIPFTE